MSTTTAPTPGTLRRSGMPGLARLLVTEARLYLRDAGTVFFVLTFPTVLLLGMAYVIPGMREPMTDAAPPFEGLMPASLFAPVVIAVAIATAGLAAMPAYLAAYRESGVLRRMSTTPMRPQGILVAQVVVNLAALLVGSALAIVMGVLLLDVPLPVSWWVVLLSIPPAAGATFGIGLIIGGLASKGSTASGIGMTLYFPMLFFAGLWTPGPSMPEAVAAVATYTPLGAASQALTTGWFGGDFPATQLVVMVVWTAVTLVIAARTFRWR